MDLSTLNIRTTIQIDFAICPRLVQLYADSTHDMFVGEKDGPYDLVKAEADFKKAASLSPKELKYQADLLELYEIKKDETSIASTISAMKVINSAVNNQEIAKYFESIKNYNLANKYFVKSVTEDKNEMSRLLLGVMYYNMGNKQDGKKLVQDAQKAGVKEADKVLEEIAKEEEKK